MHYFSVGMVEGIVCLSKRGCFCWRIHNQMAPCFFSGFHDPHTHESWCVNGRSKKEFVHHLGGASNGHPTRVGTYNHHSQMGPFAGGLREIIARGTHQEIENSFRARYNLM